MKISEVLEAIAPIGSTTNPTPSNSLPKTGSNPAPAVSGNVQQLQDPRLQAATLAQQKQEKEKQKQEIMAQIKAKQAELQDLQKQQQELNRSV